MPTSQDTFQAIIDGNRLPVASVLTNSPASVSSVIVLVPNLRRRGAAIYNESTSTAYVAFDVTASATHYTAQMPPSSYFEVPFGYAGAVAMIWATANGNARVTELI